MTPGNERTDVDAMMEAARRLCSGIAWNEDDLFDAIDLAAILAAGEAMHERFAEITGTTLTRVSSADAWDAATAKLREGTG